MHSFDKYAPRLAPSLLALKKQFENSRLKSLADDIELGITELEDINSQIDEIELTSQMSDDNFMLHVMGNLPKEYEAVFTDLENRLMANSGKNSPLN